MNRVNCPYCDTYVIISDNLDLDVIHQKQCNHCQSFFTYTTSMTITIETELAPCLNGSPHKLKPIKRFPKEFAVGREICEWCGEEVVVDQEASEKAIAEYMAKMKNVDLKSIGGIDNNE